MVSLHNFPSRQIYDPFEKRSDSFCARPDHVLVIFILCAFFSRHLWKFARFYASPLQDGIRFLFGNHAAILVSDTGTGNRV